jgi:APA family basic amino acid/polyamine antiporter
MIGSGVFKKLAPMAKELNSGYLILLCWAIAGLITLFGALTNAEIASLIAAPGGQYAYFKNMYGKFFSFLFGWSCFAVIQSASIASIAYVFAHSVHSLVPLPVLPESWEKFSILGIFFPLDNFGVKLVAIFAIFFLSFANYRGVIFGGWLNNTFTLLKLIGIVSIIALGLYLGNGNTSVAPVAYPVNSGLGIFGAMFTAMLGAFWAYDGWNNVGFLGGEIQNPKKNIPLALTLGVASVMLIYLAINFVYLYLMPMSEILRIAQDQNSILAVEIAKNFLGKTGYYFIAVLILVSTLGATNGSLLSSSRIYFAMSQDRVFFSCMGNCHPQFKTPSTSLIVQAIWTSVLVLSGTFDQLTDMLIFAAFIFYGAGAFGVFVLRKKMKDLPRIYKTPAFIPIIFILFSIVLVMVTILQNPRNAGMGLVLILSGIPFYIFWNRNCK